MITGLSNLFQARVTGRGASLGCCGFVAVSVCVWFSGCEAVEIEVCTGLGSFFICNGVAGPSGFQVSKDGVVAKCPSKYEAAAGQAGAGL